LLKQKEEHPKVLLLHSPFLLLVIQFVSGESSNIFIAGQVPFLAA